jgi:uncharacterized protein YbjT (DUF2867 family)
MRIAIAGATGTVGSHLMEAARRRGHDPVALSRSEGLDVVSGEGLQAALARAEAVIDVLNAGTNDEHAATDFFTAASGNLQRVGAEQGVGHLVTLSIVGIDRAPVGYYAAKLAQERAAAAGPVASTIQRVTQFHEFPAMLIARSRDGSRASVFDLRVQTVAARTVAEALLEVAERGPAGRAADLAGPVQADLVELAHRFVAHRGERIEVVADSDRLPGVPRDALLPEEGARIAGPTFEEWLESDDAAALSLG